jgi:hypothetical protein
MRTQSGTSNLRALFYMDEVFGFFPPTAEPPTKRPMLTLLKQARAFGLGCVLATQNPVDLDYKGLANCGTWFLGRLQTERDKLRVLDGLASLDRPPALGSQAGGGMLDRADLDRLLSSLAPRVFLAHNVHAEGPVHFQTRWVLSYLRGPLTRQEIRRLARPESTAAEEEESESQPDAEVEPTSEVSETTTEKEEAPRAVLTEGVDERWLPASAALANRPVLYRPALEVRVRLHFARVSARLDRWRTDRVRVPLPAEGTSLVWERAEWQVDCGPPAASSPPAPGSRHAALTASAGNDRTHDRWRKEARSRAHQERVVTIHVCKQEKLTSEPDEEESAFLERCRNSIAKRRDHEFERLRKRYASKLAGQEERIRKARERIDREQEQYEDTRRGPWLTTGAHLIGALFGRKVLSSSNARRAGSAARAASRVARERADVERARRDLEAATAKLRSLQADLDQELAVERASFEAHEPELDTILIRPRKGDLEIEDYAVVWRPV